MSLLYKGKEENKLYWRWVYVCEYFIYFWTSTYFLIFFHNYKSSLTKQLLLFLCLLQAHSGFAYTSTLLSPMLSF